MKKLAIACLLTITAFSCAKKQKDVLTEAEVNAVIDKFDNGWKNKQGAVVDSVLSPQYIYYTQSGKTFDREGIVATAASDVYKLERMARQKRNIRIDGNTAVVNTTWEGKGVYYGTAFNDTQRCSITIVKHNGDVRILAEHCTPIK